MMSLTAIRTHIPLPHHHPFSRSEYALVPSLILKCSSKKRGKSFKRGDILTRCFGFRAWKFERNLDNSRGCWSDLSDDDAELESELIDFMAKSEKPMMFPTKEELIKGGRMDLVEAIRKVGRWYSFSWGEENVADGVEEAMDLDIKDSLSSEMKDGISPEDNLTFLQLTTPAALEKPLETIIVEDSGIEDMLNRLEKQKNQDFGARLESNISKAHDKREDIRKYRHFDASLGVENGKLTADFQDKVTLNISEGKGSHDIEPESWRTWGSKRAGFRYKDFEAAEITFGKNLVETDGENYHDGITVSVKEYAEDDGDTHEVLNYNKMKNRLNTIGSELTSALHSLRSKRGEWTSQEVTRSSNNFQKLSDAWEFQENEVMMAQTRIRSIKAKLAIVEGQMELATIDAKQKLRVKLKQIAGANKALELLRTTHFLWSNPASEVFLAGSFDGWTTQRKMDKSSTGIFSVCLMLYPGKYEIKFIVDGIWKVDPLRPIVTTSGYENNLFIVT